MRGHRGKVDDGCVGQGYKPKAEWNSGLQATTCQSVRSDLLIMSQSLGLQSAIYSIKNNKKDKIGSKHSFIVSWLFKRDCCILYLQTLAH